jgi:DNA-binding response OmpR family regulator
VGTILLIEDDEALGRQVHAQMKEYGFAVVWWKSGRSPDEDDLSEVVLIILDLMLPGVAGLDILKQVRAISDVPVLARGARRARECSLASPRAQALFGPARRGAAHPRP